VSQDLAQDITPPMIIVEKLTEFKGSDLDDLCDAMEKTIEDGLGFSVGFNWLKAPSREKIEAYWKGLLLVPNREIFVGRLDGVIAGAVQFITPPGNKQSQSFAASAHEHFVAPWARGHGLAKMLLAAVEEEARKDKFRILKLEVRATQEAAVKLYESYGFNKWGELDKYEMVDGQFVTGYFYYKDLV